MQFSSNGNQGGPDEHIARSRTIYVRGRRERRLVLGAVILFWVLVIWGGLYLSSRGAEAMASCQRLHSFDTCAQILR